MTHCCQVSIHFWLKVCEIAQPDYLHNIVCNECLIDGLVYSQASDMSPDIVFHFRIRDNASFSAASSGALFCEGVRATIAE